MVKSYSDFRINIERSERVGKDIYKLSKELGVTYRTLSKQTNIDGANISTLVKGTRYMSDRTLDKLEPIVNAYIKVLEYKNTFEVLK